MRHNNPPEWQESPTVGIICAVRGWVLLAGACAVAAAALSGLATAARPIDDSAPALASQPSGLHGTVYRGPITPVCRAGIPCDAPAPDVVLSFVRRNGSVVRTKTAHDGSYRVLLPAAVYTVKTESKRYRTPLQPARVKVRTGRVDRIDFFIDTGIR
jgi:hypothetical protein